MPLFKIRYPIGSSLGREWIDARSPEDALEILRRRGDTDVSSVVVIAAGQASDDASPQGQPPPVPFPPPAAP